MEIKAIIFDIGDVLIQESGTKAREFLSKKYNFSKEKFEEYAKKNLERSFRGQLTAEDFFEGLISELELQNTKPKDLIESWLEAREKDSTIDEKIANLINKLRKKYIVGALSNTTFLNEKVSARKNCHKNFDFSVLSCDVGDKKPNEKIYKILIYKLAKVEIAPEETIFIDDLEENLTIPKELGIKTILFENSEKLMETLEKFGVIV